MELKVGEKNYEVVDNINDLTLKQYKEYLKLIAEVKEDSTDTMIRVIEVFSGIPFDTLYGELTYNSLCTVYDVICESLKNGIDKTEQPTSEIKVGNDIFRMINLDEMKTSEFIDLEEFVKGGIEENVEKIIAVLYSNPQYTTQQRIILFEKEITIGQVYSALVFFWTIVELSSKPSSEHTTSQLMKNTKNY